MYFFRHNFSLICSVSKATKELPCVALYYPDFCIFQDLSSGKVKEIGILEKGLYLLNQHSTNKPPTVSAKPNQACTSSSLDLNLWDERFGHVSSHVLQKFVPSSFDLIDETVNKCRIFPCSKQTRSPFPISSIKKSDKFDMVHMNV